MDPGLLKRAENTFFEISSLPEHEWPGALARMCGPDAELRAEVESLLKSQTSMQAFMDTPAMGQGFSLAAEEAPVDDMVGTRLGPFEVTRRLGAGGMGAVYLAVRRDGDFAQEVAIKVVKRGMDTEEILRRFRLERKTLAALNHPNIARLIDGGMTPDGRPWLAMEFVPGKPIDEHCSERALGVAERLALFRIVCEAVGAAHRSLVVHRDLKPGNILVTPEGEVKLLDFGVSKVLTGRTVELTSEAERRLTPAYASPEQIEGGVISTASDVYSLGVILYELLASRRPFEFGDVPIPRVAEILRTLTPPPPSSAVLAPGAPARPGLPPAKVARTLRGDLDTIVLKALRADVARRYLSVEQFSGDIDRHLAGLPVLARPDSLWYRASKFVTRHAVSVLFTLALFSVLVGAVLVVASERDAAVAAKVAAELARDQSEEVAEFLSSSIAAADPFGELGPEVKMGKFFEATRERIATELSDKPLVEAASRSALGRAYLGMREYDKAKTEFDASMEIRRRQLPSDSHDIAESHKDLAAYYHTLGKPELAEPEIREALRIQRAGTGERSRDTAECWNGLGGVLRIAGKPEEAEAAQRQALGIRQEIVANHPSRQARLAVAESLNNLASTLADQKKLGDAKTSMLEAMKIREELLGDTHPLVCQTKKNVAVIMARGQEFIAAGEMLAEVADAERQSIGPDHPERARTLRSLGRVLMAEGQHDKAVQVLAEALAIFRLKQPPGSEITLSTQLTLAEACQQADDIQRAITLATELADGPPSTPRKNAAALLVEIYTDRADKPAADKYRAIAEQK